MFLCESKEVAKNLADDKQSDCHEQERLRLGAAAGNRGLASTITKLDLAVYLQAYFAARQQPVQTKSAANQHGSLESERHRRQVNRHMQSRAAPGIVVNLSNTLKA